MRPWTNRYGGTANDLVFAHITQREGAFVPFTNIEPQRALVLGPNGKSIAETYGRLLGKALGEREISPLFQFEQNSKGQVRWNKKFHFNPIEDFRLALYAYRQALMEHLSVISA